MRVQEIRKIKESWFRHQEGNVKDMLVTYDSYCSHSMMDSNLATDLGLELEPLGTVTTAIFMGN